MTEYTAAEAADAELTEEAAWEAEVGRQEPQREAEVEYTEAQYQADVNEQLDLGGDDAMEAFYTGHRELSAEEYERCAAAHNAEVQAALDRRDEAAAWLEAHPDWEPGPEPELEPF